MYLRLRILIAVKGFATNNEKRMKILRRPYQFQLEKTGKKTRMSGMEIES